MLPKQHRLLLRKHVNFFSEAKRAWSTNLIFFTRPSNTTFTTTVIVPKKIEALATKRNLLKRKISTSLLQVISEITVPLEMVVVAKASAKNTTTTALALEIKKFLEPYAR